MCEENKAVLYGKMAKVMGRLTRIKESGKHAQGWRYATSEDVKDAVRVAMSEEGLALLVSLENYEVIELDKGIIVRGRMAFTLCCSETGATKTRHLVGEAADQAKVSDKAFYKLYTTLTKYFLKTTFLISSGEELDSDADGSPVREQNGLSLNREIPWHEKSPSMTKFLAMANREFGLEKNDILDELRAANFTSYKASLATKMWEALEKARQLAEEGKIPNPDGGAAMDEVEAEEAAQDIPLEGGFTLPETDGIANLP